MKKGLFRRFLCGTLTGLMCLAGTVPQALEVSAADQTENYKEDGYDYELWNQNAQGSASMQSLGNGAFSCKWSNIENVLFRTGKKLGSTQDYKSYDGIYIDYDVDYNPQGNSYMCVYGWTENGKSDHPTVEYYIVEAWGSWRPPGSTTSLGTVTSDGKTYDIYRTERVNQPSIHGTETFYQYWSVQKTSPAANNETTHLEGTITVSNHFDAWENAGLDMSGKMYEVALNIEGYRSNGSATVNKNDLVFGSTPDPVKPAEPVEPDSDGYYFKSTFESGKDSWSGRGDASVATDASNYYGGKSSLKVSGRTDNWHGTAINLDPNAFTAGNTYSFGTAVMQNTEDSTDFKLTLQYTDASSEDHYDEVAHATASKGKWTALSNSSYTIPAGATGMILYVEAPDSLTDFYIDDAFGAVKGKNFTIDDTDVPTTTTTVTATEPVTTTTQPDISVTKWGDTNLSGEVELGDAVLILQAISNPEKYGINGTDDTHITAQGMINGDVDQNGNGLTAKDALSIQKYIAKLIDELPESYSSNPTTSATSTVPATTTMTAVITTIDTSKPMVAICFDDGAVGSSSDSTSMRIINAIANEGFRATFFYVGNWINSTDKENEVKSAYSKGMEIANHSTSHPDLTTKSASEIRNEYDTTQQKLRDIIGAEPAALMRLPYLACNSAVQSALSDVSLITCSIDTQDWNGATSDQIIARIKAAMNDGSLDNSIVLCHETYASTAEAIEYLAPYLKEQGWQIVTVSELFEANGKTLEGGNVYTRCN